MTMLSPRPSTVSTKPRSFTARAMAVVRGCRVRDAGMGGLVKQSPAALAHRQHPAGRSRGTLLCHDRATRRGGVTQTKQPPANPGRFRAPRRTIRSSSSRVRLNEGQASPGFVPGSVGHIRADMCDLYSLTKGQSASFSDKMIALVDDSIVGLELGAPSSHGAGDGSRSRRLSIRSRGLSIKRWPDALRRTKTP